MFDWYKQNLRQYEAMRMIRPFNDDERRASIIRERMNSTQKCVSCGSPSSSDFCGFCLAEE